jgi:hypothetical protein
MKMLLFRRDVSQTMNRAAAFAIVTVFGICAVASTNVGASSTRNADAQAAQFVFEGETVASKGLFGEVLMYLYERRSDKSCKSIERVDSKPAPMMAAGGFPKRHKAHYLRDDAYESWDITFCSKKHSYIVKFAFENESDVLYWTYPLAK